MYIDCARGYAVLMVMACHLAYEFAGLPYAIKRVAASGWFGVQLFFLASCITLLMSWWSEHRKTGRNDVRAFFIRRFFRIAPAYYAAALLYAWLIPPPAGFAFWQAAATLAFVNAWHPVTTPTIAGGWVVVPGGWSISVEFAFYALFPFFAAFVTSLRRALIVLAASIVAGVALDLVAGAMLRPGYDPAAIGNFLFFWFPDQASVFALGGVLLFCIREPGIAAAARRFGTPIALSCIALFCTLTYLPFGHYLGDQPPIPAGLASCVPLMGFLLALSANRGIFVNRAVAAMGRVSFSAYLLHFAVLRLFRAFPAILHTGATAYAAIAAFGAGLLVIIALTYAGAWLSTTFLEQPMIRLGKRLAKPAPAALY